MLFAYFMLKIVKAFYNNQTSGIDVHLFCTLTCVPGLEFTKISVTYDKYDFQYVSEMPNPLTN